jgi:putative hemolysin
VFKVKVTIFVLTFLALLLIAAGCTQTTNNSGTPPPVTTSTSLANPASVFCEEKGYRNEIRKNPDGSEYGVCIFPGGAECEEWAYYRGTCNETTAR